MAKPARKFDDLPTPPSANTPPPSNITELDSFRRDHERAQRLQSQKRQDKEAFSKGQVLNFPTRGFDQKETDDSSDPQFGGDGTEALDRLTRRYRSPNSEGSEGDKQENSKKRNGLGTLKKARSNLRDIQQVLRGGQAVGLFGMIMFMIMGSMAGFLDILPVVTGGLAAIIDWILDAGFFFMLFITMVVVTGDLIRSMFGFRGIINLAQTILEFIPASDIIPWHTVAVIVLYLDVKYGIVKIAKNLKNQGTSAPPKKVQPRDDTTSLAA